MENITQITNSSTPVFKNMTSAFLDVTCNSSEVTTAFTLVTLNYSDPNLLLTSLDPLDPPALGNGQGSTTGISTMFRQFALIPMTSFGVAGNILSLWVWMAETTYNSSVFMLKVLAMWDTLYCLVTLLTNVLMEADSLSTRPHLKYCLTIAVLISQICSIYATLLSSVTRLFAIFRPALFNLILSRPRIIALCVAILLWSILLSSFETAWYVCLTLHEASSCQHIFRIVDFYRENYLYDLLAFCIPSFLLLFCNVLIVWKFTRHRKDVSGASSNQGRGDKTVRLSVTMVMISVTSLLSYPVAVAVRLGLNPGQTESDACNLECFYIVVYFSSVLTAFNSCVNVLYYLVIASRFRELLRFRVSRLCPLCVQPPAKN